MQYQNLLGALSFYSAHAHFFLLILLVILTRREIAKMFRKLKARTWILLLVLILLGFLTRDDNIWIHPDMKYGSHGLNAKNMLINREYMYCPFGTVSNCSLALYPADKDIGYSFFIYLGFLFFGFEPNVMAYTSFFFGILLIPAVFLLAFLLFRNETIALLSALLVSISHFLSLSAGNAKIHSVSLFFMVLTICAFLIMLKHMNSRTVALTLLLFLYGIKILPENIVLAIPLAALLVLNVKLKKCLRLLKKSWVTFVILGLVVSGYFLLMAPLIADNYFEASEHQAEIKSRMFLHPYYIFRDASLLWSFWRTLLPFGMMIIFAISFVSWRNHKKEIAFLLLWFFSFTIIYLLYYVPFHREFATQTVLPVFVLIALGLFNLSKIVEQAVIRFYPSLRRYAGTIVTLALVSTIMLMPNGFAYTKYRCDYSCNGPSKYLCGDLEIMQKVMAEVGSNAVLMVPRGEERDLWAIATDQAVIALESHKEIHTQSLINNETYFVKTPNFYCHGHLIPIYKDMNRSYNLVLVKSLNETFIYHLEKKDLDGAPEKEE